MKKNMLFILSGLLAISFLSGCSTLKIEAIKNAPIPAANGKIVFINTAFSERELSSFPLIDAGIYNKRAAGVVAEIDRLQKESAPVINNLYIESLKSKTACEVVSVSDISDSTALNRYEVISPVMTEKIKTLCKFNKASYAVAMTMQVSTIKVSAFGFSGDSILRSYVYIFDKDGVLAGKGFFVSAVVNGSPTNTDSYKELLQSGEKLSAQLIAVLFK